MAASAHIVHQRKKFRKQKSLVSMSYTWSVPKFLTSDENLKHQSQKTDFTLFLTLWIPSTEADILSAIRVHSQDFWIFFLHRPIVTSHAFQLIMMNPKNLMSVATQGLHKEGGLIGPPLHLEVSLQACQDRVKGHGCSLHLQNQDREPKLGSLVYQRPVTISKSRSRCQTPVRNLQHPPKPQMRT